MSKKNWVFSYVLSLKSAGSSCTRKLLNSIQPTNMLKGNQYCMLHLIIFLSHWYVGDYFKGKHESLVLTLQNYGIICTMNHSICCHRFSLSAGVHCSHRACQLTYNRRCLNQRAGVSKQIGLGSPDIRAAAQSAV